MIDTKHSVSVNVIVSSIGRLNVSRSCKKPAHTVPVFCSDDCTPSDTEQGCTQASLILPSGSHCEGAQGKGFAQGHRS